MSEYEVDITAAFQRLLAERDELRRQSESWRLAQDAWQEWGAQLVEHPDGGRWGDSVARARIAAKRDELRAALKEACEIADWALSSVDAEQSASTQSRGDRLAKLQKLVQS